MRLLLFSDLHLDSPFAWANPELARARRLALRGTLQRICELANSLDVDALCCAGDLFEHERCAPDTAEFLRDTFAELNPIRVFIAPGEEDWFGPTSAYRYTAWSPNVRVFHEPRLRPVLLAPGLTLWGAGHCARSGTPSFLNGFRVDRGGVNIALFHGCARDEPGGHPETASLAPFQAEQVIEAGLHHALVGHFRAPSGTQVYTYAGGPDELSFAEAGHHGGAALVTVGSTGAISTSLYPVGGTRMSEVEVDVDRVATITELRDRLAVALAGASGIVRATLVGAVAPEFEFDPDRADLTGVARQLEHLVVRVDQVRVGYDVDALARQRSVRGRFVADVEQSGGLSERQRHRVLVTGLRALAGRHDLAVS